MGCGLWRFYYIIGGFILIGGLFIFVKYRVLLLVFCNILSKCLYFIGVGGFLVEMGFLVVWWNFYDLYFV